MNIQLLPYEVFIHIFSFVSTKTCQTSAQVCWQWNAYLTSTHFLLQRFKAPALSRADFKEGALKNLAPMIPWEEAATTSCYLATQSIVSNLGEIAASAIDNRNIYFITHDPQMVSTVFHKIQHGTTTVASYPFMSNVSVRCLQKYKDTFFCCSSNTIYKFSVAPKGITVLGTHELRWSIREMCIVDENTCIILRSNDPTKLVLYDCTKDTNDTHRVITIPDDVYTIHYDTHGSIWSLHKDVSTHGMMVEHRQTKLCKTPLSMDDDEKYASFQSVYAQIMTRDDLLLFWGKKGCGVVALSQEPNKAEIIHKKSHTTLFGKKVHFSGMYENQIVVASKRKISLYDPKTKIVEQSKPRQKTKRTIGQLNPFKQSQGGKPLFFDNALFFYTVDKDTIRRHFLYQKTNSS